jgi:ParB-like nuclease family protein
MFKKNQLNRAIVQTNLQKVMASIKAKNLLQFRPIIINENFEVIDGQHRLEAAKILGVEIYYEIDRDSHAEDMILLNMHQRSWGLDDYLNFYLQSGKEEYRKFEEFTQLEGLSMRQALNFLRGSSECSRSKFKAGTFKFPSALEYIKISDMMSKFKNILDLIERMKIEGTQITSKHKFREALTEILHCEDIDFEILRHKISINLDKMRLCANSGGYLLMLRDIYNWKNKRPVNLLDGKLVE